MQKEPIRVAHIVGKMIGGGVEQVVMNYFTNLDHSKIQFDFIVDDDSTDIPEKEILSNGGRIFKVSGYQKIGSYQKDLMRLFSEQNYQIVHSHINTLSVLPLQVAKKAGIPIRIAHNHSTAAKGEWKKNLMKWTLRLFAKRYPTHYMAPTEYAGRWLFGDKVPLIILRNGIDPDRFVYNDEARQKIRKALGVEDGTLLFGNVGRMVWQKNQVFLLKIFAEAKRIQPNAKCLIIGNGPLEKELIHLADDLFVKEDLLIVQNTERVEDYFQAMDMFIFPSNYEGLGMVAVEAQVSGLPVLKSDNVPDEVQMTPFIRSLSLELTPRAWAEVAQQLLAETNGERKTYKKEIEEAGYSIQKEAEKLENIYERLIKDL
ncbi:MAG: glycosyltransferase family 1 protein [Streptococcaceae bacterium]|jgi:glycosyltransferase involved in cell wall biosynthesis|nr:glycosyltransferase family 1 protein [Streptococcaceae bacterium]